MPTIVVSGNTVTVDGTAYRILEIGGQSGDISTSERKHRLKYDGSKVGGGWPSVVQLYQAVLAYAPSSFDGCAANAIDWSEDEGTDHLLFNVDYTTAPPEATLRWGFDTSGGTIRVTSSRGTTSYPASGRTAPDFKGAIGVRNGEPEGVDVIVPALKLTATYKFPKDTVNIAYIKTLAGLTGGTNNDEFYTFAAGELLFLGASGEVVPGQPTEITYNFAASANVTGLSLGSEITSISKLGHQYLWVAFEGTADSSAKKLVQRPLAAYVETLYKEIDFEDLAIGT